MKKTIFLVLTLAIPVSIFLFLKFFGSNSFDVPILFEHGIPNCESSPGNHIIPEFEYIDVSGELRSSVGFKGFFVFGVLTEDDGDRSKRIMELVRIQDAFYEVGSPKFVILIDQEFSESSGLEALIPDIGLRKENYIIATMPKESLLDFCRCGIGMINDQNEGFDNLVLVDPEKNIRGIYNLFVLKQTDQLILELKILNKMM